ETGSHLRLSEYYPGPMIVVLPEGHLEPGIRERLELGLVTYILGPDSTPDPDRPGNLLRDVTGLTTSISADALLESM
ncbi:hypothetical protein, partial [uncultured Rhodococcus sp.]